ncbi:hypothetical protein LTR84_001251 [Exophiala bonariae]|uniref:Uncharacterized protein n=1 Tax=Exophiala bonariae TaxID=1690606 RepID=A0AAV9NTC1_9EURO|nr:hypothetical protein LTR84_001251 [Exophiala bonariae]
MAQIQVINKSNYKEHHLVTLPAEALLPLAESSIRVQTTLFSLTTNNFTYVRFGDLVKWWDFHPLPPTTPAPYNDPEKYGRISCWGIGHVIESTTALVPEGTKIYGYIPIGTLPVTKRIEASDSPNYIMETTEHRAHLSELYNRYFIYRDNPESSSNDFAWDAAMKVLFETSYLINRFALAWDLEGHPPISPNGLGAWSVDDADLKDTILLVFAPSSKTAAAFAQQCRVLRPRNCQPHRLVGVGSDASKSLTEGFGWYDEVAVYSDDPIALVGEASIGSKSKVVIIDFGSRGIASASWANKLHGRVESIRCLLVGTSPTNSQGMRETIVAFPDKGATLCSAIALRSGAIQVIGPTTYFNDLDSAWDVFKKGGAIPGVTLKIGDGMNSFMKGWDDLASGKILSSTTLLFEV